MDKLQQFMCEPGLIRNVMFQYDGLNKFRCTVNEADSQPEYYDETFKSAYAFASTLESSFDSAVQKLKEATSRG